MNMALRTVTQHRFASRCHRTFTHLPKTHQLNQINPCGFATIPSDQPLRVCNYSSNLPAAHHKLDTDLRCGAGSLQALELLPSKPGDHFDLVRDLDCVLPVEVQEQRLSNLLQSLLVAVCLREHSPSPLPPPTPLGPMLPA